MHQFYSVPEVGEILRLSEAGVRRLIRNGSLEAVRLGSQRGLRIPRDGLQEFLQKRRASPTEGRPVPPTLAPLDPVKCRSIYSL